MGFYALTVLCSLCPPVELLQGDRERGDVHQVSTLKAPLVIYRQACHNKSLGLNTVLEIITINRSNVTSRPFHATDTIRTVPEKRQMDSALHLIKPTRASLCSVDPPEHPLCSGDFRVSLFNQSLK